MAIRSSDPGPAPVPQPGTTIYTGQARSISAQTTTMVAITHGLLFTPSFAWVVPRNLAAITADFVSPDNDNNFYIDTINSVAIILVYVKRLRPRARLDYDWFAIQ